MRLYGHAYGFVNVDVGCTLDDDGECGARTHREWEIHLRVYAGYRGSFKLGPNISGTLVGLRFGLSGSYAVNVLLAALRSSNAYYELLRKANEKAGGLIRQLMENGAAAMCLLHAKAQ